MVDNQRKHGQQVFRMIAVMTTLTIVAFVYVMWVALSMSSFTVR